MSRSDNLIVHVSGLSNNDNERTVLTRQIAEAFMQNNPLARVIVQADRDNYHAAGETLLDPGTGFEGTIRITDGGGEDKQVELHVQRWDMPDTWDKSDDPIETRLPFRLTATGGKLKSLVEGVIRKDPFPLPSKPSITRLVFQEIETTSLTAGCADRTVSMPAKWFGGELNLEVDGRHDSYSCEGMVRGIGGFTDVLNIVRPDTPRTNDDPQVIHFNSLFTLFIDLDLAVYSLEILDRSLVVGNGLSAPQYKLIEIELE